MGEKERKEREVFERMMSEHKALNPNYEGSYTAPLPRFPENGNLRSWEEIDRERQARFRRCLGPKLYGWLNDNDTGEF